MVVDDSHLIRKIFIEILESHNFKVITACNGFDAIEKIKQYSPDSIVTDLLMPGMNGYELCRWLKRNPSTQKIPVLLCSSRSYPVDLHWAKKQGADGFLCKPFNSSELFNTLKPFLPLALSR